MRLSFLMGLVAASLLMACSGSNGSQVAADVNGEKIYVKDVDSAFGGQISTQIYSMRKGALDEMINQKLLEAEAKKKNLSADDFLKQEIDKGIADPTDEELKAVYEANKDQLPPTFEEAKGQIINVLKRNRAMGQRNAYIAGLKEKAKIEIKLEQPPQERVKVSVDDDPAVGPATAKVTVIEFSDFQCPFCSKARATVDQILSTYKDDVRYVFRDFPLSFHKDAFTAHVAAGCASEQKKYWEYNKILFNKQKELAPDQLKGYAKELGLDTAAFNQCLDSNKFAQEVEKDMSDGVQAGVGETPAFFVNGISVQGARPFSHFKEIIDGELKKK